MGHWRQPVLLFILPKKPQEMNDLSSFLAVFFYGLMSQSLFFCVTKVVRLRKSHRHRVRHHNGILLKWRRQGLR